MRDVDKEMSFNGITMSQGDIVLKVLVKHDRMLIGFLNSFLDYNHANKEIVKIITKTIEERKKDGQPEIYAKVLAELTTGDQLVFHLYKKGVNLLIAHTKKETEIEVL